MSVQIVPAAIELTTTNQTVYTVPDNVDVARVEFGVCNNIGADTTITLWVVPFGETESGSNQYMTAKTIQSATPNPMDAITGMSLETGDSIIAVAGEDNRLNLRLSLLEVTYA